MSIDDHLDTQLAEYFGWLEGHLATTMRSTEAAAPRPRRRLALLLGAAAAVVALVAVTLVVRNDDIPSIGPATSGAGDPTLPSTVPTTAGSTTPTATTGTTEPTEALTWAPLALPPTMELVDAGEMLDFGAPDVGDTTRAQQFVRLGDDGVTVEASLSLTVRPAEGGEVEAWIPNGDVHGLPAIISTPSLTATNVWWVEEGQVVTADASGFGRSDLLALLESIEWRADRSEGFEPSSIAGGLTLLYDSDLRAPRRYTNYVIHDLQRGVYVTLHMGPPSRLFDFGLHRLDNGLLVENKSDARSNWMLLTDDGVGVSIGYSPWDPDVDLDHAIAIAEAMRPATSVQLADASSATRTRLRELPVVGSVTFAATTVELRGGTADEPAALCMTATDGPACEFNEIRRDGNPVADVSRRPLLVDGDWFIVGVGLDSLHTAVGQTEVEYPMRACSANSDGSLIALLPDERAITNEQEYFLVAVPADVDYVRVCIDVDGGLRPNSFSMTVRPLP